VINIYKFLKIKFNSNPDVCLGGKKDVKLSHVRKISEKKMGLFSGRLRISGSNNFKDWFHFDATRPAKTKAIVLETDFQIYKRLWITPERHNMAFNVLKKLV